MILILFDETAASQTISSYIELHVVLAIIAELIFLIASYVFQRLNKRHWISIVLFPLALMAMILLWRTNIPIALSVPPLVLAVIVIYNNWGKIRHFYKSFRVVPTWYTLNEQQQADFLQDLKSHGFFSIWKELSEYERSALFKQYEIAKLRGFWSIPELDEEIKKHFLKAKKVKIKVTRGYNLFFDDGTKSERDIFYHCIFDAGRNQTREIELLLHFPCKRSPHTIRRAAANHISVEQYISTLFKVIVRLKEVTKEAENKNVITVRFYNDYEIKWRYYIFQERQDMKTLLYLNYYDDNISGADSSMLKIEGGEGSLCQDFNAKFDQIFGSDKSFELVTNEIDKSDLLTDNLCGHHECDETIKQIHKATCGTH